jgi:hypothetical protein
MVMMALMVTILTPVRTTTPRSAHPAQLQGL